MIWNDDTEKTTGIIREKEIGMSKITYVEIVRCKDCGNRECDGRAGTVVCGITGESHSRLWFCADGEKVSEKE